MMVERLVKPTTCGRSIHKLNCHTARTPPACLAVRRSTLQAYTRRMGMGGKQRVSEGSDPPLAVQLAASHHYSSRLSKLTGTLLESLPVYWYPVILESTVSAHVMVTLWSVL